MLMMGGHITQGDGESKRSDTYNGRTVHTLSSDYQTRVNGGNGLLRILEFDPSNNRVAVQTYSPYTNSYESDANSQFALPVDLNAPARPFTLIGTASDIKPGASVKANWPVEQNTAYEWYVTVHDGEKTTQGPPWSFTTNYSVAAAISGRNNTPFAEMRDTTAPAGLFMAFPNPNTTNQINLSLAQEQKGMISVMIYDISGALRQSQRVLVVGSSASLQHDLPEGTYTIVVQTASGKASRKIIVANN